MIDLLLDNLLLLVCAASLALLGSYQAAGQKARRRRLMLAVRPASGATAAVSGPVAGNGSRQGIAWLSGLRAVTERLDILKGEDPEKTALHLATAGFSGRDWLVVYAAFKLLALVTGLGIGAVWLAILWLRGDPVTSAVFALLTMTLGLLRLPDLMLVILRRRRQRRIRRAFPDMIELALIASEAGLSPALALQRAAHDLRNICADLAQELRQLSSELALLTDRAVAFKRFSDRIALPEAQHFTGALVQAEKFGTPFSTSLRGMIKELRSMRLIRIEERAAKLPVLMTIPLIACIMPALFVVLLGPAALDIIDNIGLFGGTK